MDDFDITPIELNIDEPAVPSKSSASFGGGIELLMNEKKDGAASPKTGSDIDISDLDKLENELNDVAGAGISKNTLFTDTLPDLSAPGESINIGTEPIPSVSFKDDIPDIGKETATSSDTKPTWDGFSKFNEIRES